MVEKFKDNEHDDRRIGRREGGMRLVRGAGEILSDVCSVFLLELLILISFRAIAISDYK